MESKTTSLYATRPADVFCMCGSTDVHIVGACACVRAHVCVCVCVAQPSISVQFSEISKFSDVMHRMYVCLRCSDRQRLRMELQSGDLYIMSGDSRWSWLHGAWSLPSMHTRTRTRTRTRTPTN